MKSPRPELSQWSPLTEQRLTALDEHGAFQLVSHLTPSKLGSTQEAPARIWT